jgi:hypothetical protein
MNLCNYTIRQKGQAFCEGGRKLIFQDRFFVKKSDFPVKIRLAKPCFAGKPHTRFAHAKRSKLFVTALNYSLSLSFVTVCYQVITKGASPCYHNLKALLSIHWHKVQA